MPSGPDVATSIRFSFEDRTIRAQAGQSVAAALWAAGEISLRDTPGDATPRGLFCGMGVCFDCLVTIDGRPNRQACLVAVAEGMQITRQTAPQFPTQTGDGETGGAA